MEGLWILMLFCLTSLVLYLVIEARKDEEHFKSKNVLYLWNSSYRMFFGVNLHKTAVDIYNILKQHSTGIAGMVEFGVKTTVVRDPELIKRIFIKDFDHFTDRRTLNFPKHDTFFSRMLLNQKGDKWRDLRSKMSPAFTTGKIKKMFQIMKKSGDKFVQFLESECSKSKEGEVNITLSFSKMTMDIIASTACGIDSQAFLSTKLSMFEKMGNRLRFQFGGIQVLKLIILALFPMTGDRFGLSFFDQDVQDFFKTAISGSIRRRQEKGEQLDDFIQLLLAVRANKLKLEESEMENLETKANVESTGHERYDLDENGIIANCVLFIIGGFETVQSLLSFTVYALALDPQIQHKLREEIETILDETNGEVTYDGIMKMEYLDMVINETLRHYPPVAMTDRGCVKDYAVPGTQYVIKKNEGIMIPIRGLHHDETYWPEPEKFIPERFSAQNKQNIKPYTFMPFGHGPRNCIAMRFALAEVKVTIVNLIRNFKLEPSPKTLIPMKYTNTGTLSPEGGMWLAIHKRRL